MTYATKIEPAELELHLDAPAIELSRVVRIGRVGRRSGEAVSSLSRPRAHEDAVAAVEGPAGTLSGTSVVTGHGSLELLEVQPEGRKRAAANEWLRGVRPAPGERLGS